MKRQAKKKIPQVTVWLDTSLGTSRAQLQGIFRYVHSCGPWSITIIEGGADAHRWKDDGIIARVMNNEVADAVLASRLPVVLLNPDGVYLDPAHPLSRYSRTQSDSAAIGTLAAEFFLKRTPRHTAFVGAAADTHWSRERQEAFVGRLAAAGLPCHVYPPPSGTCDWGAERPRLCRWLRRLPKPAALFAANDTRARQVLNACLTAEIAVPYEMTVLGVDNNLLTCETSLPPLSSIAIDIERAGYDAALLLDRQMQRCDRPGHVIRYSPCGIVERTTTADIPLSDKRVIRALEFIRINAGFNIRVSDVAKHLGVTSRWAERCAKQALGHSLHEAIHRTRMATVRKMVADTHLPFTEIARRCGFQNVQHLCKRFKDDFGHTMGDLRQRGVEFRD